MGIKTLALITARGGSKRIPGKNIKLFLGVPIISYSIAAALGARCFDEVMVSTDDSEIAEIAKSFGAKVPFLRSEHNSCDYATTVDVIEEVITKYKEMGMNFKHFCCIYPTAPFITEERLIECMKLLRESGADSVLPIVRFSYPIQRSLKLEDGRLGMFWPENYNKRSQDLEPAYHDAGQFYCMKVESFLRQKRLFADYTLPIILNESEVQDIDTEEDWRIAEMKYRFLKNNGHDRK